MTTWVCMLLRGPVQPLAGALPQQDARSLLTVRWRPDLQLLCILHLAFDDRRVFCINCRAPSRGAHVPRTPGPPTHVHSICASLAMSSSSQGAAERGCIDRAAYQMANVPTGGHDGTPDSVRGLTPAATVSPHAGDTRICCRWLRDATPPKTERPRQSTQGLAVRHSLSQAPVDDHTASAAAKDLCHHRRVFRGMPQPAQRAAFYAGIWRDGSFTVPLSDAVFYGNNFVAAQGMEHERLLQGHLPRRLTLQLVTELAAQAASSAS